MLFRQIVFYALLMGLLAGTVVTVVQTAQVVPIILSAETYEGAEEPALAPFKAESHTHGGEPEDADAWAPADGMERTLFTFVSNTITAMGFALLVLVAMFATRDLKGSGNNDFNWRHGLIWGAAGYAVFWLAPAIGMPPEIPLATTAPLEDRQLWWGFAAICTAAGLSGLAFAKSPWRWGLALLVLVPHIVGAPHHEGALFADQPPEAAAALEALAQQFVGASAIANASLWIVLGLVGVWALRRIIVSMDRNMDDKVFSPRA